MKKVILTLAAVFAFGFANAQEEVKGNGNGFAKGNMFVSGAVSFGSESTGDDKSTGFEIEPKFGYFVTNNIAVGGKIGFASQKAEDVVGDTQDDATFSVGVFGRYYATPANNFSLFGQLGFDYMTTDHKLGAGYKTNGFEVAVKPGISYFVSNNFAIEATFGQLGYETSKDDTTGAEATDKFGVAFDLRSIGFGMIYKF